MTRFRTFGTCIEGSEGRIGFYTVRLKTLSRKSDEKGDGPYKRLVDKETNRGRDKKKSREKRNPKTSL